jgi:hypothetical protein
MSVGKLKKGERWWFCWDSEEDETRIIERKRTRVF